MKTTDLFIKKACEDGRPMDLKLPNGETIKEALNVIGADSDAFADEIAISRQKEIDLYEKKEKISPAEYAKQYKKIREETISCLVTGWSFDEPFNRDAVIVLFINAPYVLEQVDKFASIRENFFVKPSLD